MLYQNAKYDYFCLKKPIIINGILIREIYFNPYYEKHNKEYLEALKKRGIKLSEQEFAEKLITDDLIREVLVPQLDGENDIRADGRNYQHTYYFAILYRGVRAYKLVWCVADDEPHVLGLMDCFRIRKYDKK